MTDLPDKKYVVDLMESSETVRVNKDMDAFLAKVGDKIVEAAEKGMPGVGFLMCYEFNISYGYHQKFIDLLKDKNEFEYKIYFEDVGPDTNVTIMWADDRIQ